jgi:hypothetical protein
VVSQVNIVIVDIMTCLKLTRTITPVLLHKRLTHLTSYHLTSLSHSPFAPILCAVSEWGAGYR